MAMFLDIHMNTNAMKLRNLFAALALLAVTAPALPAQEPLRIDLNIPTGRLLVYEGDRVLHSYPVSVGKPGFDTPTGSFSITHADWNPDWRPPQREWTRGKEYTPPGPNNPMGRVKLFFMPLYFIHGSPEKDAIGTPASHGCVRMLNDDAVALSRLLHERAAPHVSSSDINRILANSRTTRRVNFRDRIDVVIRYDPVVVEDGRIRVYPDLYKRNAVHQEAVYQALLASGYDIRGLDQDAVRSFVESAKGRKSLYQVSLAEAFGDTLVARAP
jgi:murein L,D-transpeptidase YcbB/YkuD